MQLNTLTHNLGVLGTKGLFFFFVFPSCKLLSSIFGSTLFHFVGFSVFLYFLFPFLPQPPFFFTAANYICSILPWQYSMMTISETSKSSITGNPLWHSKYLSAAFQLHVVMCCLHTCAFIHFRFEHSVTIANPFHS